MANNIQPLDEAYQKFTDYADQMLLNIADEVNIQEVRLKVATEPVIEVVYHYDTIKGISQGFTVELNSKPKDSPDTLMVVLTTFFSGDVVRDMEKVRRATTTGLRQRSNAKIKVRQPLRSMTIMVPISSD